ncbi:MAG TPA: hypothetical protein VGV92_00415 [Gammaproteobacteria bacterium]|nr:hypothetical protein [Gammaproteobacteria bacterium]
MNDNNQAVLRLDALYSEPFLNYLSIQDLGSLRQINRELYQSSRLKKKMLLESMRWIQEESCWSYNSRNAIALNANNPNEIRKTVLNILFHSLMKKNNVAELYSFYLFLGGNVPFDLIKTKAKQERRRDQRRECAITTFSCAPSCLCISGDSTCHRCTSLCFIVPFAILCLAIPPCIPETSCAWLTYTGAATLGTTAGGTTVACLEKKFHIFTFCCEPYKQLEKLDNANSDNQAPARIEMLDDEPAPIQARVPVQRNSFSNCLRGLFFKRGAQPSEVTPLVSENNSCTAQPGYVKK